MIEKRSEKPYMKKVLSVLSTVLVWVIVAATVCIMVFTLISVNTFDQANRSIRIQSLNLAGRAAEQNGSAYP